MLITKTASCAVTSLLVLLMLGGCSSGNSEMAPDPLALAGTTQSVQSRVAQYPWTNSILALYRGPAPRHSATTPNFLRPDAKRKPLVFVSDDMNNVVDIFLQKGSTKMVGQITGLKFPSSSSDRCYKKFVYREQRKRSGLCTAICGSAHFDPRRHRLFLQRYCCLRLRCRWRNESLQRPQLRARHGQCHFFCQKCYDTMRGSCRCDGLLRRDFFWRI